MLITLPPIKARLLHRFHVIAWFRAGWKVPSASEAAGNCLLFWFYFLVSHVIAQKENNPLWAGINQVVLITAIAFILLGAIFSLIGAALLYWSVGEGRLSGEVPDQYRMTLHRCMSALPTLLFALWGIVFLNGYPLLGLNRAVLFLWATYLLVGWMIAFQRAVANIMRERQACH